MKLKQILLDARVILFINNLVLVVLGMVLLNMPRTWTQILFGLSIALLTEFLFIHFLRKEKSNRYYQYISSIVTAIGLILVINAVNWWVYGALSFIAIASKHLLKKNVRDHLFNPANFAIVFFIALSSTSFVRIYSDQFAMSKYILYQVLVVGVICSYLVSRLTLIFSYSITFLFWGLLLNQFQMKMNFYDIVGSEVGVGSLIYLFFMITDPRTSPSSRRAQIIWGVSIASLSVLLKYHEVYYSRFIALFIATSLGGMYEVSRRATGKYLLLQENV
jgi:Na+-translocating ferredoxin:NAD+ oxidoreductase RnfD subunit